jgi:hypothetical protein
MHELAKFYYDTAQGRLQRRRVEGDGPRENALRMTPRLKG